MDRTHARNDKTALTITKTRQMQNANIHKTQHYKNNNKMIKKEIARPLVTKKSTNIHRIIIYLFIISIPTLSIHKKKKTAYTIKHTRKTQD